MSVPGISLRHSKLWPTRTIVIAVIAVLLSSLLPPASFQIVWAAGNYPVVAGSDSPIGYWRLDETTGTAAADASSGHANPLTYQVAYTPESPPAPISVTFN